MFSSPIVRVDAASSGPSPQHISVDVQSVHALWLGRQFFDTINGEQAPTQRAVLDRPYRAPSTLRTQMCDFCRLGLANAPKDELTSSVDFPDGIHGLQHSAKTCAVCAFFLGPIEAFSLDRVRRVRVCYRMSDVQAHQIHPMLDILLEVTWRMEKSHLLVYCPQLNPASTRAIWGTTFPVTLPMRANLLREWLRDCEEHHKQCSETMMHNLPTRLLHISPDGDTVRVEMLADNSHRPDYAALSHCWGVGSSPLSADSNNIDKLRVSIPVAEMTKTFRDAVAITKSVGLQYLWIDSLCIIQDDIEDWQNESAKMGSIYENATFTIAASSAKDSAGGCFLELEEIPTQHIDVDSQHDSPGFRGALRSAKANPFAVHSSALNRRGWVLQEMILSRRILHFTKDQIYWQCRELAESEDGAWRETSKGEDSTKINRVMLYPNTASSQDLLRLWRTWAIDYSRRQFTFPADRLFACAGITQYFNKLCGKDAVCLGLRREQLQKDLLWMLRDRNLSPRINAAGLPSWTWLSRNASLADEDTYDEHRFEPVADIKMVDLEWEGNELASPLRAATVTIVARLTRVQIKDRLPSTGVPYWNGTHSLYSSTPGLPASIEATAVFDDEAPECGSSVTCLEMLRCGVSQWLDKVPTTDGRVPIQRMLILRPVEESESMFERIGTGAVVHNSWAPGNMGVTNQTIIESFFDGAVMRAITLI